MNVGSFSQQGKRAYQEDSFYVGEKSGLFMVCDGIGGASKGDEASRIVIDTIRTMVEETGVEPKGKALVHQLVVAAQMALKEKVATDPQADGMGTTLTMAYFHEEGLTLAHIGDSRIYYIKPEEGRYWQSKDHSLVQELFDSGVLKREEDMESHPMRNRITRALQGRSKESKIVKADVLHINHLKEGDMILLCSDGALEPYTGNTIVGILANSENSFAQKIQEIKADCAGMSKDNNTCVLIELEKNDNLKNEQNTGTIPWRNILNGQYIATEIKEEVTPPKINEDIENDVQSLSEEEETSLWDLVVFFLFIGFVGFAIYYYFFR